MKTYEHMHGGHRQRLKDKVREHGLKVLSEHEILELILTYTIPYKDTNELAHSLINRFGSLSAVLNANKDSLINIKGVGEETALFLTMLPELLSYYRDRKDKDVELLNSVAACISFFRKNYEIQKVEHFYVMCLSSSYKLIDKYDIEGEDASYVIFDTRNFASMVTDKHVKAVVLFHTHPNGKVEPSDSDLETTRDIFHICAVMGIKLCDHLIFNETCCYSFEANKKISEIYDDYINKFPERKDKILGLSQLVGFETYKQK